jgi:hypothetical protein
VDNAPLVRSFQSFGDLLRDDQGIVNRDRAFSDAVRESRPFNQLHDQCQLSVGSLEPVDHRDVGMAQGCQSLRFTVETSESFRVVSHRLGQNLDRHLPGEVRVGGSVDLTHATHTELGTDFVRADTTAWGQRQAWISRDYTETRSPGA